MIQYYLVLFTCVIVLCVVVIMQSVRSARMKRELADTKKDLDGWKELAIERDKKVQDLWKEKREFFSSIGRRTPLEFYVFETGVERRLYAKFYTKNFYVDIILKVFDTDDEEYNENCANELLDYLTKEN